MDHGSQSLLGLFGGGLWTSLQSMYKIYIEAHWREAFFLTNGGGVLETHLSDKILKASPMYHIFTLQCIALHVIILCMYIYLIFFNVQNQVAWKQWVQWWCWWQRTTEPAPGTREARAGFIYNGNCWYIVQFAHK